MRRHYLSCICLILLFSRWAIAAKPGAAAEVLPELPPGLVEEEYGPVQIKVAVSGTAPFTYALGADGRPEGLSVDPETGMLSGKPTAGAVGNHRVRVVVTDYNGKEIRKEFVLRVTVAAATAAAAAAASVPAAPAVGAPAGAVAATSAKPAIVMAAKPAITSATAGLKSVTVLSPVFPKGVATAKYDLLSVEAGKPCDGNGTPLILAGSTVATASTATNLQPADPLKEDIILCAKETFKRGAPAFSDPFTTTGSPSIASVTADATTVDVMSPAFPAGAASAKYGLFTVADGKACTDSGKTVKVTGADAKASDKSTVTVSDKLAEKANLCAAETFDDANDKVVAVAYSSPIVVAAAAPLAAVSPTINSASAGVKTLAVTAPGAFPPKAESGTYAVYHVAPGKPCVADASQQINTAAGTSIEAKPSTTTTLTLLETLQRDSMVCAALTYKDKPGNIVVVGNSNVATVTSLEADWGRVRAYFVGGLLITNDSTSFSSAHQFYALNVEKTWRLPQCYLQAPVDDGGGTECITEGSYSTISLAGGTMHFAHVIYVNGGSGSLGPPFEIRNAKVTVTGPETITLGAGSIQLQRGQSFTLTRGTFMLPPNATTGASMPPGTLVITDGELASAIKENPPTNWAKRLLKVPGVTSYFETRLTSIPVASNATNTTCNATTGTTGTAGTTSTSGSSAIGHASPTTAGCSPTAGTGVTATAIARTATGTSGGTDNSTTTSSFLTSQQTANVGVGVYLPFLLSRWIYANTPNALFIAPIAKVGFNTITGATSQTVVLPANGGTGTQSLDQIYNFYDYGFRIGHMGLTNTAQVAPELYSFLDFSVGRFSNLESLICHQPYQRGTAVTGSGCGIYGSQYTVDSRKRLYRIDIEGLLKIPATPLYVGLNANIGQKQVLAEKLDPNFAAPNDLRFLFGTKFDIAQLFQRFGVKQTQ